MLKYLNLKLRLNLTFLVGALLFVSCSDEKDIVVYVNDPVPVSFTDLPAAGKTGNTFIIVTNSATNMVSSSTTDSSMITFQPLPSRSVLDAANGIYVWTVTFDVSANRITSGRSATLSISIDGVSKTVSVSQEAAAVYADDPASTLFVDLPAGGKTGNTFTIETNSATNTVSPTTDVPSMITNLKASRSVKDAENGIYLWTVTFNVSANTSTSVRSATISVPIGGVTKTITVSQVAVYVNEPVVHTPFDNLPAAGKTGYTFTIETNSATNTVSPTTTNPSMITFQPLPSRSDKDVANGIYLWTVTFDVSANMTTSSRSATISIPIDGVSKTVSVSQVAAAVYVNEPVYTTPFDNLPAAGQTGYTFTIETNSATNTVSPTTTNPSMITFQNPSRFDKDVANGIYLWTVTFDVSANMTTSSRSATISIPIGGVTKTVQVSQQGITASFPPHMHDGMTNCYMVVPGGNVNFPVLRAYKYDGNTFTNTLHTGDEYTGTFGVEVVWQDVTNLVGPAISGAGNSATVHIQANGTTQGNAVVAIKKGSDIVWSYHIWVTNYDGAATWTNPDQTAHTYTFMDRNLGATEAALSLAGRGLFYQWGRKDPFPGIKSGTAGHAALDKFYGIDQSSTTAVTVSSSNNAGAIVESIQKPTTFYSNKNTTYYNWLPGLDNYLWSTNGIASGSKTIYDPCPAGWRVPARVAISYSDDDSPWKGLAGQSWTGGSDTGGVNWGANALYPAAGYRTRTTGALTGPGANGYYWSATVTGAGAYSLGFNSGNVAPSNSNNRAGGYSVRCVQE